MDSEVRLRFLGTRAIHAGPGRDKVLYGGNSSCIVLEDETSTIIFNAGFGINPLGDELIRKSMASKLPVDCHILLSDYLWDNVQGLPFFTPIHFKSSRIHIHTANPIGETQLWLNTFMDPNYSPFDGLVSMRAHLCYPAADGPRAIGDWTATVLATKHPLAPYQAGIWRLEHQKGLSIGVVMTAAVDDAERQHRTDFLKGVHILIHSAIAPAISHPTMGGRATFHEAVDFRTAPCKRQN